MIFRYTQQCGYPLDSMGNRKSSCRIFVGRYMAYVRFRKHLFSVRW